MVLVDTSVWISHFRKENLKLARLLNDNQVAIHPFIIEELACGNIKNRADILSLLHELPLLEVNTHDEILYFIEQHELMGKGMGIIDIYLLAASLMSGIPLWTLDKKLSRYT